MVHNDECPQKHDMSRKQARRAARKLRAHTARGHGRLRRRMRGDDAGDLLAWGRRYLPEHFTQPPSAMHRWLAEGLSGVHRRRGTKLKILIPNEPLGKIGMPPDFHRSPPMPDHLRRAYSYIRFSSPKQELGDSVRRQVEKSSALAKKNGWLLDEVFHLRDLGVSGYRSFNATKRLGVFLTAIENGSVPKGSVLIVESLDRLSRDQIDPAHQLFRRILLAGIDIATTTPEDHFTKEHLNDPYRLIIVITILSRSHEESEIKSVRCTDAWDKKRSRVAEEKLTPICPAWLRLTDDRKRFILIPEAVKTIRFIYRWRLDDNIGAIAIAKRLNHKKIPTLKHRRNSPMHWESSMVKRLLSDRRLLGELQLYKGHWKAGNRSPAGKVIKDYYPQVIPLTDFQRVQRRREAATPGQLARKFVTLCVGLMRDARDKTTIRTMSKRGNKRLISQAAMHGYGTAYISFPYNDFEEAFLHFTSELSVTDLYPPSNGRNVTEDIEAAELQVEDSTRRIKALTKKITTQPIQELIDVIAELDAQRQETNKRLEQLKAHNTSRSREVLNETKELVQTLKSVSDNEVNELRLRLRGRIVELIQEIWILAYDVEIKGKRVAKRRQRVADIQVFFRDGGVRQMCIVPGLDSATVSDTLKSKMKSVRDNQDLRHYNQKKYEPLWNWIGPGLDEHFREFIRQHK